MQDVGPRFALATFAALSVHSAAALDSTSVPATERPGAETAARSALASRFVDKIVVTAQKREELLQDVPISISAFSGDTLDARGISDPKELQQITPGLTLGSQAAYTVTYLRGVGSDAFLLADPSVALYIDGIYFPFAHGQAQNFGSLERIEVLKGPQGTLFGRNAVGGAINVITASPTFDRQTLSLQTSYSEYNDIQNKVQLNIPLSDALAFGVSGISNTADNYRSGSIAGHPLPEEVTRGARVKVRWAPQDWVDVTLAGFRLKQSGVSTMFATNSDPSPLFSALITPQTGLDGAIDSPAYFTLDNTVVYGQTSLFTEWFDIKLLGSHQNVETGALYDYDGSPTPLVFFEVRPQGARVKTAELQVLSNSAGWHSDRLKWIFGYYYFNGRQTLGRIRFGVADSLLNGLNAALAPILDPLGIPPLLPGSLLIATGSLETISNSIFAEATYDISDLTSLTLGLRAQDEKRTLLESGGAIDAPVGPDIPYTSFGGQADVTRSLKPKISLQFRPWNNGLVYASYQQAIKSSTYNVVNFLKFTEPEPVEKEELTSYEIGIKSKVLKDSTTLSAAAFFYDIKNLQVQFLSLLAGGAVTFENAPAAEIKGFDFDITTLVFPSLTPGLVVTLGGAYLDARFTDFPDGQGFNELGLYSARNNYTGKRIPRSPRFSGAASISQTFNAPHGSLELASDYYYNSGFYYLAQNTDFNHERAYGLLGARISYLYEPWNLRTTVFGKNILDQRYNYSRFTNDFGALDAVAPPAIYGVRINWEF